jgi:diguanylate cyclase (GGDEF)-like protein/PAS domain S-box-containing protein
MLNQAKANLSALLESTDDLIWSVDLDYRLISFNKVLHQHFKDAFGVEPALGMVPRDLVPPERAELMPALYKRVLAEGSFRTEFSLADGRALELFFNSIVVDGISVGISVFGKDITEKKAADDSRRFLAEVVESCEEAIITSAPSGEILTWNYGAECIYGYTAREAVGMPFSTIIAPERRARAELLIGQLLAGAPRLQDDGLALCKDGRKVRVNVTTWPIRNSVGKVTAVCTIIRDISSRYEAEKTRALLASIIESSNDAVHAVGLDGTVVSWNRGAEALFGYTSDEIIGKSIGIIAPAGRDQEVPSFMSVIANGGGIAPFDTFLRGKDGRNIDVSLSISPIRNEDGEVVGAAAIARDIRPRRHAEQAFEEAEKKYRDIFENAMEGICQVSPEGKMLTANLAMARMLGYNSSSELITLAGSLALDVWGNPEERTKYVQHIRERGYARGYECQFKRKDGTPIWVSINDRRVCDAGGQLLYLEGFMEDITERKRAEEALHESLVFLRESQKVGALGSYALNVRTGLWTSSDVLDEIFGIDKEYERTVTGWLALIHPEDRAIMADYFAEEVAGKCQAFNKEYRIIRRTDQAERWVHGIGGLEFNATGQPVKMHGIIQDITKRKLSDLQLLASEERYRATFQMNLDSIDICQLEDGKFIDVNDAFLKVTGFKREEVIGHTAQEIGIWANPADRLKLIDELREKAVCMNFETQYRTREGELRWGLLSVSQINIGGIPFILSITRDITDAKAAADRLAAAQDALRISEERYRTAFQTSIDAINLNRIEDGKYIDCNHAFLSILGYERDEVIGRTSEELGVWANPRDRQTMAEMLLCNSSFAGHEFQFRKKNGQVFWGEMSASKLALDGVPSVLSVTRDISSAKAAAEEIRILGFYDALTGLPNRRQLSERLRQALAAGARRRRKQALLFIDLDDFKNLNDTLGHQMGDLLLQEVARRLVASIREADVVCRLGGDEFIVLLEDLSEVAEEAAAQARAVGEKILAAIDQPYLLDGRECHSSASIGIAVSAEWPDNANEFLQQADLAMYQAKAAGRSTMRFFSPALQTAVNNRAALEDDLRQGIKTKQFLLYYQPQVEFGRLTGVEALIRWQHPRRGLVLPDEFIPLAEESRLILPLGDWVLQTACAQIAAWAGNKQTGDLALAVNISALLFRQPEFVKKVLTVIDKAGANPKRLQLEITESILVENFSEAVSKITELRSHGVSFSLDDFGTGYSSLTYLKRLPLDHLKIDRSFVRDMLADATSGAIAQTIISLGRAMDLSVIAEGVETEEQRGFLAGLGCHSYQGFLFSQPLPLDQFEIFLGEFAETHGPY